MTAAAFDASRILAATRVQHVECHQELASTNDRAIELARRGESCLPLLILTQRQTRGRGRGDHHWWSDQGSLTFSLLLDMPQTAPGNLVSAVSPITAVAVAEALDTFSLGVEFRLKWPNDVYVGSRKLSGILIESTAQRAPRLVIGIGINVNNSFRDAPEPLYQQATSLADSCGRTIPLQDVLISVLGNLHDALQEFSGGQFGLPARWNPRCLLSGKTVRVSAGKHSVEGLCHGIEASGGLLLVTATGPAVCMNGTVEILARVS